jgi:outer membrane phospholipase A
VHPGGALFPVREPWLHPGIWVLAGALGLWWLSGGVLWAQEQACDKRYLHDCETDGAVVAHRPNYVAVGRVPPPPVFENQSGEEYEMAFQLSVRLRATDMVPLSIAYTQQSYAIFTCCSSPFREHVFWPEVYLDYELNPATMSPEEREGWGFRGARIGADHQSNGRDDAQGLSRSWTRAFVELKFADGSLQAPPWLDYTESAGVAANMQRREPEFLTVRWKVWLADGNTSSGVRLVDHLGYTQLAVQLTTDVQQLRLAFRDASEPGSQTVQMDYGVVLPSVLRAHVMLYTQYFSGVGQTLLDFDHRHTRWLVGLMLTR